MNYSVKFSAIGISSVLWLKKYNLLNHMELFNIMIVHKNLFLIIKIDRLSEVIVENFIFLSRWISSVKFWAIGISSVMWSKKYYLLYHMELFSIMIVHKNLFWITKIDRLSEGIVKNFYFFFSVNFLRKIFSHRNFLRIVIEKI